MCRGSIVIFTYVGILDFFPYGLLVFQGLLSDIEFADIDLRKGGLFLYLLSD